MNFIHAQFNQYFTPQNQIRTSNSLQFFKINFYIERSITISKRSKGLLAYVFFSACAKWLFFFFLFFSGQAIYFLMSRRIPNRKYSSLLEHVVIQSCKHVAFYLKVLIVVCLKALLSLPIFLRI